MNPSSLGKLSLSLLAVLVPLIGLEVALRILGYDPFGALPSGRDLLLRVSEWDDLGYQLAPNAKVDAWGTHVETNSFGLRDDEYPIAKDGRYRIVVIGDSITFGNGILHEDLYTEVLERSLRSRFGDRIDVINLAVGGYDVVQEVASLEHLGIPFSPDLVILGFCTNDIGHVSPNLDYIRSLDDLRSPLYRMRTAQLARVTIDRLASAYGLFLQDDSEFYESKRDQILPVGDDPALSELMQEIGEVAARMRSEHPLQSRLIAGRVREWYGSSAHVGMLEYAFARLAALQEEHGFQSLVTVFPILEEDPSQQIIHRILAHEAKKFGFRLLDLTDGFRAAGLDGLRLASHDVWHPNAKGHALVARELEATLLDSGLLARVARRPDDQPWKQHDEITR